MQPRTVILTTLLGGTLMGTVLGLVVDPQIVPPPEPHWRQLPVAPVPTEPQHYVDLGPQDLSPTWDVDHMPTWKRRALEREAAAYAAWEKAIYAPVPEPQPEEWATRDSLAAEPAAPPAPSRNVAPNVPALAPPVRVVRLDGAALELPNAAPPLRIVRVDRTDDGPSDN